MRSKFNCVCQCICCPGGSVSIEEEDTPISSPTDSIHSTDPKIDHIHKASPHSVSPVISNLLSKYAGKPLPVAGSS